MSAPCLEKNENGSVFLFFFEFFLFFFSGLGPLLAASAKHLSHSVFE